MQEMWVLSLGREDSLEKKMEKHSSIVAWKTLWTEKAGRLQSKKLESQSRLSTHVQTLLRAWGFGTRHREHSFMDEMRV